MKEKEPRSHIWILSIIGICVFIGLAILIAGAALLSLSVPSTTSARVAVIHVAGPIVTQDSSDLFSSGGASSDSLVEQITQAGEDVTIDAILFDINSPGGSGVASDEIAQAIARLEKPTVTYVRDAAASGAYWVASATDYIVANRFSTVGSIGVIASYLDFTDFIQEWNISYVRFVAGDKKDFGTPFREPTALERQLFQQQLDELHSMFIEEVAKNRGMTYAQVSELADGFIFTGVGAQKVGLVDEVGTKDAAIVYLEETLNATVVLEETQESSGLLDLLYGYSQRFMPSVQTQMQIKT